MVATIKQISGMETYIPREAYEIPSEEPGTDGITPGRCGVWWNPWNLFDGVEDNDAVTLYQFRHLARANNPDDGEKLIHADRGNRQRPVGLDLTFTADKTISALWAIAPREDRDKIDLAVRDAVRGALEDTILKYCSIAWLTVPGDVGIFVPGKLVGAVFPLYKDAWGNPHLHTRCVLFNCVQCHRLEHYEHDEQQALARWAQATGHYTLTHFWPEPLQWGLWGSLPETAIREWTEAAGALFRCYLAYPLQHELGVRLEQYGPNGEFTRVAGIPQELIDMWSGPRPSRNAKERPNGAGTTPNGEPSQAF